MANDIAWVVVLNWRLFVQVLCFLHVQVSSGDEVADPFSPRSSRRATGRPLVGVLAVGRHKADGSLAAVGVLEVRRLQLLLVHLEGVRQIG